MEKSIRNFTGDMLKKYNKQIIRVAVILGLTTFFTLEIPRILSKYIDNLGRQEDSWLYLCALVFCLAVVGNGLLTILNSWLSEKLGWEICDFLRVDLLKKIIALDIQVHKKTDEGNFLERIEGDVNLLLSFFSTMVVEVIASVLMIAGVLVIFCVRFLELGIIFIVLSAVIIWLFLLSQRPLAKLWVESRNQETAVLEEFIQDFSARKDIAGAEKEDYVLGGFRKQFQIFEQRFSRASFWGNFPSTLFYSLLNVGEGIALILGIMYLREGSMTLGEVYLVLSYVELLNSPFFVLKYEFSQLPQMLAALRRIQNVYSQQTEGETEGAEETVTGGAVRFEDVTFGYEAGKNILENISLQIESGQHVLVQGRTGGGKSTMLQLMAGIYHPDKGVVKIGGKEIRQYKRKNFNRSMYYILQNNPILEDTIRNNITRWDDSFSDEEIRKALARVGLEAWINGKAEGIHAVADPGEISQDKAQLLAWSGAILRNPQVLLVDEFDAMIKDETVAVIDSLLEEEFKEKTVVMVSHQKRSRSRFDRIYTMENGRMRG